MLPTKQEQSSPNQIMIQGRDSTKKLNHPSNCWVNLPPGTVWASIITNTLFISIKNIMPVIILWYRVFNDSLQYWTLKDICKWKSSSNFYLPEVSLFNHRWLEISNTCLIILFPFFLLITLSITLYKRAVTHNGLVTSKNVYLQLVSHCVAFILFVLLMHFKKLIPTNYALSGLNAGVL